MLLDLSPLKKAIASLDEAIGVYQKTGESEKNTPLSRTLRAGVIQNFEFTYELSWKFIKRWLALNVSKSEVEGLSRRGLFRMANESCLIDSIELWMQFHQARNETSHTYDHATAEEVLSVAQAFLPQADQLYRTLASKNDEQE